MKHGIKQFARRILAIHLVLLAILLAVVYFAARQVYRSARAQALQQARNRQALLATQTAHAIENFYEAILYDLQLMKPPEEEGGDPDPSSRPATRPEPQVEADADLAAAVIKAQAAPPDRSRPSRGFNARLQNPAQRPPREPVGRGVYAGLRTLQGRSHLFMYEEDTRGVATTRTIGGEPGVLTTPFEEEVVARMGTWLRAVKKPTVSGFVKLSAEGQGVNLVVAPQPTGRLYHFRLLIAAVGVRPIEREFLDDLNLHSSVDAYLFDDAMTVMAGSDVKLVARKFEQEADAQIIAAVESFKQNGFHGTRELNRPFTLLGRATEPAMITAEPIHVLDKQWVLLITSPLSEVDAVVKELSRKAAFWAAFVAVAMAGILVSTATQLIRSRMRMERVRHQLLQGELRQARQIQLAWLPDKTKSTVRGLDIASINRPASHISGDFYNFFELPDARVAVVIGDVTGHGIAAAFLMATTQLLVRTTLPRVLDPGACLEEVNLQLCTQAFSGQFVTMQVLVIDPATGAIEIAGAGHPAPLIGSEGRLKPLTLEPQLVLGVDRTAGYHTERFTLHPGEILLLYTDGVVEAENSTGKRLRLDGLLSQLGKSDDTAQSLIDSVLAAVNRFRGSKELKDDLTLVSLKLMPAASFHPPALVVSGSR